LNNKNLSYLIFRIVDFVSSRNIISEFKLNDKILLILYDLNERPYIKKYNREFECTVKDISVIGNINNNLNSDNFFEEILIQYGLEINNNDTNIINKLMRKKDI